MIEDFLERHRPRKLDDLAGNRRAKLAVARMLTKLGIPRGVIFEGPRGCGKTSLARILARAYLCEDRPPESPDPCGACYTCKLRFRSNLGFERGLIARDGVKLTPELVASDLEIVESYEAMVIVYDEIQEARQDVQVRLRVLLETGCSTKLILCTSEFAALDPALRLRLVRVAVSPPTREEIVEHMAAIATVDQLTYDRSVLEEIADQKECIPRRCLSGIVHLVLQADSLTEKEVDRVRRDQ